MRICSVLLNNCFINDLRALARLCIMILETFRELGSCGFGLMNCYRAFFILCSIFPITILKNALTSLTHVQIGCLSFSSSIVVKCENSMKLDCYWLKKILLNQILVKIDSRYQCYCFISHSSIFLS